MGMLNESDHGQVLESRSGHDPQQLYAGGDPVNRIDRGGRADTLKYPRRTALSALAIDV